jgi:hypothetical protein
VTRTASRANVPHGTMGAPVARRQLAQWQKHGLRTEPVIS